VPQGGGRGRAARAGALHDQIDGAILEAPEGDVAAVAGHRRADAGFEQFLDGLDRGGVLLVEELLAVLFCRAIAVGEDRRAGHEVLHDRAEDGRLQMLPFAVRLRHGDEVVAEEHGRDARHGKEPLGERGDFASFRSLRLERAFRHHDAAGQEFQGGRIGSRFGLDKHGFFRPLRRFKAGRVGVRIVLTGSRLNVEWNKVDSKGRIYAGMASRGCTADPGTTTF
jgi:hypothetical protein